MSTSSLQNNLATTLTQPVVLIVVTALIVAASIFTAYQRFAPPKLASIEAAKPMFEAEIEDQLDSRDIINMNLFGAPQAETAAAEQDPQDIPETNLRLALKGAFAHSVAEKANALIAPDRNSKAELFFIDDELPGGAVLDEVYPDYVIIRRNGQREKLQFLRSQPGQNSSASSYKNSAYEPYTPPAPIQNAYVAPEPDYDRSAQYDNGASPQSSNNDSSNPGSLADIQRHLLEKRQKLRQKQ